MKICSKCKHEKELTEFYKHEYTKDRLRAWCKKCIIEYKKVNSVRHYTVDKKRRDKHKQQVLDFYGAWCNCCGEKEPLFLSIDHINNDGYKQTNSQRSNLILKIIKEGFPDTYQILCMNCNFGKARNKGVCPHAGRSK